jgi:hypothetical protein
MNKEDLRVDQAVVVWSGMSARRRYDARVAKIARKYVTIEVWRAPNITSEIEFDILTQKERGNTSNYAATFHTAEQQERSDREREVRDTLRFYGLLPKYTGPTTRRTLTLAQMEAVVSLLDQLVGRGDGDPEDSGQGTSA